MDAYSLKKFGRSGAIELQEVTENEIKLNDPASFGTGAKSWPRADVAAISVSDASKVSVGRVVAFGVMGALAKRTDVQLTLTLTSGDTHTFTWKKGNAAEVAQAFQVRGWSLS